MLSNSRGRFLPNAFKLTSAVFVFKRVQLPHLLLEYLKSFLSGWGKSIAIHDPGFVCPVRCSMQSWLLSWRVVFFYLRMLFAVPQPDPNQPKPEGRQMTPVKGEPLGVVCNWPPALEAALQRWGTTQAKCPCLTALDVTGKPVYTLTYGKLCVPHNSICFNTVGFLVVCGFVSVSFSWVYKQFA